MNPTQSLERPRAAGFTLIELVIVIVIIGVLASLAIPSMSGSINRGRLDRASSEIAGDIAYARMLAVRRGEPVRVVFTSGSEYVIRRGAGANPTVIKTVNLASEHPGMQVAFGAASGGAVTSTFPDSLVFNSRGILRNGSERTIRTLRAGAMVDLRVSVAGRVQREKY